MSEDEGTEPTARGAGPDEEPAADEASAESDSEGPDDEPIAVGDGSDGSDREASGVASDGSVEADTATDAATSAADPRAGDAAGSTEADGPETEAELRDLLDRIADRDGALAEEVAAVVETARDVNETVEHQRRELSDLRERNDEQAETIENLHGELTDRDERIDALESELAAREDRIDELESDLESATERVEELEGALKRKQADFQNYKKRAKKRQEQLKSRATEDLVGRIVGVRDNLKRALDEDSDDAGSLREGVDMTLREFDRVLADENVSEIEPEPGSEVDPQRHEVMVQIDSEQPEGTVAEVFTPGYEMGDKVIQTAQVTVSNGAHADDDGDASGDDVGGDASDDEEPSADARDPSADSASDDESAGTDDDPARDDAVADVDDRRPENASVDESSDTDASDHWEFDQPVEDDESTGESDRTAADGDRSDRSGTDDAPDSDTTEEAIELGGEIDDTAESTPGQDE